MCVSVGVCMCLSVCVYLNVHRGLCECVWEVCVSV